MNCPKCGKPATETEEAIFGERGEYNEARDEYEDEAYHNIYRCECGTEFCVITEGGFETAPNILEQDGQASVRSG